MKNRTFFLILILIAVILLGCLAFAVFSSSHSKTSVASSETTAKLANSPNIDELMAIIKKSPSYPDFLNQVKTENFGPELVEYYNFSPQVYAEKKVEWEKTSSQNKALEKPFDTIQLNENSFFVQIKSKSDPECGLTAILDMAKKEPQIMVINMQYPISIGM